MARCDGNIYDKIPKNRKASEIKENYKMTKTRVDDMLIEMISPKIKEIEEKFSSGDRLDNKEIQFLLLIGINSKFDSRYNALFKKISEK